MRLSSVRAPAKRTLGCAADFSSAPTNEIFLRSLISMRPARQIICVWHLLLERPAIRRTGLELFVPFFTTDRPGGFHAGEIHLLRLSSASGLSLAMKAHAGYDIASGLLRTYLGHDAGSRVHSGAVERGTVDSLLSVLWYAGLRGFARISDVSSGAEIVHMLNDVFETVIVT